MNLNKILLTLGLCTLLTASLNASPLNYDAQEKTEQAISAAQDSNFNLLAQNSQYVLRDSYTGINAIYIGVPRGYYCSGRTGRNYEGLATWEFMFANPKSGAAYSMQSEVFLMFPGSLNNSKILNNPTYTAQIMQSAVKQLAGSGVSNFKITYAKFTPGDPNYPYARQLGASKTLIFQARYAYTKNGRQWKGSADMIMACGSIGTRYTQMSFIAIPTIVMFSAPADTFKNDIDYIMKNLKMTSSNEWKMLVSQLQQQSQMRAQAQANANIARQAGSYSSDAGSSSFESTMDYVRRIRSEQIRDKSSWVDSDGIRREYSNF